MSKEFKSKLLSLMLSLDVILLAGCGNKVDCSIEGKHMHEYTNEYGIERVSSGESDYIGGYNSIRYDRTNDYVEINSENEDYYKFISNHNLVNISDNYNEIVGFQSNLHDYLVFRYSYPQVHTSYNGKSYTTYTTTEYAWTTDPHHSSLTGATRVMTHVYYGYNIVKKSNGKYKLQKSGPVNDIDLLIQMGYTYIDSNLVTEMVKNDYLKEIGIMEDTDDYDQEYDGEKIILILK